MSGTADPAGNSISRRTVLKTAGAGLAGVLSTGTAAAGQPDRFIVGTSSQAAVRNARSRAASVKRVLDFGAIGQAVAGRFSDQALDALTRQRDVRYIEPDGQMHAISIDASDSEVPWGVDRVDAEKAHADGYTGSGADIAILDTGIDSNHPDLQKNLGAGKAFVNSRGPYAENWDDDNGHGTHCAGIADAVDNDEGVVGVSTAATLHAVKILDNGGSGSWSDVAAGIEYTADQGWDVGSMSIGGGKSQTIKDACQYAYDRGVLLVAAAGNSSTDVEGSAPATYATVMAISATNKNDNLASFSNYGDDIELAAPGVNIYSTYAGGGYETLSGTSMACPHVSGTGGQLMAQGDGHTEARSTLKTSAEDIGLSSTESGAGLLDVEAALGASGDGNTAPTVDSLTLSEVETGDGDAEFDAAWQVSDADGDLSQLDLALADSTEGTSEDSATPTIGGDSASGTTRLVATGDDGSGHSYEVTLTVTDGNGNTSSGSAMATESEPAPAVDSLSVTEVETSNSDAEFDASWAVSDPDGELATVDLTLTETENGETEESLSLSVSGSDANGTERLVAAGDDSSGHTYDVKVIVTDADNQMASATRTITESEASPPSIDDYSVTEAGSPNPHAEITADWTVGDVDGDLATVTIDVINADTGQTVDSATSTVSGSDASGSDQFTVKHADGQTFDVILTVSDSNAATSDTARTDQVTE